SASCCDLYESWLRQQELDHSPQVFRRWIATAYCPGACRCRVQLTDRPTYVPRETPSALGIRVHNTSTQAWQFLPGTNAGIHAGYVLWDEEGRCLANQRAGL